MNCKTAQKWMKKQEMVPRRLEELPAELQRHVASCTACAAEYSRQVRAQELLHELGAVAIPDDVLDGYMAGVHRKLEEALAGEATGAFGLRTGISPLVRWLRPAVALAAVAVAAAGIWWFGIHRTSPSEMAASDTLEYYLESFDEESSSNPTAVVKGMEFEWAYYGGEH